MNRRFFLKGSSTTLACFLTSGCMLPRVTEVNPSDSADDLGSVILDQSPGLEIVHVYADVNRTGVNGSWLQGGTGLFLREKGNSDEMYPNWAGKVWMNFPNLTVSPEDFGVNLLTMPAFLAGGKVEIHHDVVYDGSQNPRHTLWTKKNKIWKQKHS